jgi:NAD(P)-dependent dehydrogenase (short-subunit alcohol dehydrogenase family)
MSPTPDDPFDLTGRVALVTGAAPGGLGHFSAVALAGRGATVVAADVPARAGELDGTVAAAGVATGRDDACSATTFDVTAEAEVEAAVHAVVDRLGRIDILVHHAGVMLRGATLETDLADWQRVVDTNLSGTWLTARAVARDMVKRGYGRIVTTASIYARIVGPIPEPAYYASKAGVANLTRGLASEWGRSGITVNCVAPGVFFPTQMTSALAGDPGRLEEMGRRTLVGRLGDPAKDLSGTIIWLVSDAAGYVTGQVIYVDGGWTAW